MADSTVLVVDSRLRIPLKEFEFSFARSGGPGGQNVNKLNTKATLRWPIAASESLPPAVKQRFLESYATRISNDGELIITSQRFRDQGRNIDDCLEKLREMLAAVATPPKKRRPTRPTKASKERRLNEKRATSQKKQRRRDGEF